MRSFSDNLYARLQAALHDIALTSENMLNRADRSADASAVHIRELKQFTQAYTFPDLEDEILFFKEIKPRFLRELLFYIKVFEIESRKPVSSTEDQQHYYQRKMEQVREFFEEHNLLYMYYRLERTHLDKRIFKRGPERLDLLASYDPDADDLFSNIYSFRIAQFQAYEDLIILLKSFIEGGSAPTPDGQPELPKGTPLIWEGNNAAFYELIYGLVEGGYLKTDIKNAMERMGAFLNVKVGNYYGCFQAMRIRKKNRTVFWDAGKAAVIRRMDESDEHPRFH